MGSVMQAWAGYTRRQPPASPDHELQLDQLVLNMNYSWILLVFLTVLEVLLFHTVFVDLVTSVIHLETLTHSISPSLSPSLLSLLSTVNLCISLLHVLSVCSDLPLPLTRLSLLQHYTPYLRVSLSYWFLFKIVFSVCLLTLVWRDVETMGSEQVSILSILASSTGFLCLVQRLSGDLSLLSSCAHPGYHHYTPVRTDERTNESQEV